MNSVVTFVPSQTGGVVAPVPQAALGTAGTFAMPAVDGSNLDTQVSVSPGCTAYVAFAAGAMPGPNTPGTLVVQGGTSALLVSNPATAALAASSGRPLASCIAGAGLDPYGSRAAVAQGPAAAAATQFSAMTNPAGGTITITRGTATAATTF